MDRSEHPQTCANCLQSHTLPTYLSGGSKSPQGDLVCNPIFRQIHMPAIIEAAHDSPFTGATFVFQAAEIPTSLTISQKKSEAQNGGPLFNKAIFNK